MLIDAHTHFSKRALCGCGQIVLIQYPAPENPGRTSTTVVVVVVVTVTVVIILAFDGSCVGTQPNERRMTLSFVFGVFYSIHHPSLHSSSISNIYNTPAKHTCVYRDVWFGLYVCVFERVCASCVHTLTFAVGLSVCRFVSGWRQVVAGALCLRCYDAARALLLMAHKTRRIECVCYMRSLARAQRLD